MSNESDGITCPYCKEKQCEETLYEIVTYWGDGSPVEVECEDCGKDFLVDECVIRTFECTKMEKEITSLKKEACDD